MKVIVGLRNFLITVLFAGFSCCFSVDLMAQPGDPPGDEDVPITGIEWLLIGGSMFGAKKVYDKFKSKS